MEPLVEPLVHENEVPEIDAWTKDMGARLPVLPQQKLR